LDSAIFDRIEKWLLPWAHFFENPWFFGDFLIFEGEMRTGMCVCQRLRVRILPTPYAAIT